MRMVLRSKTHSIAVQRSGRLSSLRIARTLYCMSRTAWMKEFGLMIEDDYIPQKGHFHADLMYNGENVFSVSAEGEYEGTSKDFIQLGFNLGSEEAVKRAVSVLSEGKITPAPCSYNPCVADVVDKYGVWWFLSV